MFTYSTATQTFFIYILLPPNFQTQINAFCVYNQTLFCLIVSLKSVRVRQNLPFVSGYSLTMCGHCLSGYLLTICGHWMSGYSLTTYMRKLFVRVFVDYVRTLFVRIFVDYMRTLDVRIFVDYIYAETVCPGIR